MTHNLLSVHSVTTDAAETETEPAEPMTAEHTDQMMGQVYAADGDEGGGCVGVRRSPAGTGDRHRGSPLGQRGDDHRWSVRRGERTPRRLLRNEAENLDAALEWAAKTVAVIGAPIEVRPFWDEPGA